MPRVNICTVGIQNAVITDPAWNSLTTGQCAANLILGSGPGVVHRSNISAYLWLP